GHKERIRYLAALGGGIFLAYAAAAIFVMKPDSLDQWRVWLLGSAVLNVSRNFGWHGGYCIHGLEQWIQTSLNMVGMGFVGSLALIAMATVGARSMRKSKPKVVGACLWWL